MAREDNWEHYRKRKQRRIRQERQERAERPPRVKPGTKLSHIVEDNRTPSTP